MDSRMLTFPHSARNLGGPTATAFTTEDTEKYNCNTGGNDIASSEGLRGERSSPKKWQLQFSVSPVPSP